MSYNLGTFDVRVFVRNRVCYLSRLRQNTLRRPTLVTNARTHVQSLESLHRGNASSVAYQIFVFLEEDERSGNVDKFAFRIRHDCNKKEPARERSGVSESTNGCGAK